MMNSLQGKSVLLVDDDKNILLSLEMLLKDKVAALWSCNIPDSAVRLQRDLLADIVLLDMNFTKGKYDGEEGLQLIRDFKRVSPEVEIVVVTAFGDDALTKECLDLGVRDFIQKPWSNNRLITTLENIANIQQLNQTVQHIQEDVLTGSGSNWKANGVIGESPAMKEIFSIVEQVAETDANILILGENGTGKGVLAKAIHKLSTRAKKPFYGVDLGTIPENLFESELFGAKKGAYTGLAKDKLGRFVMANQGTLFLDEIGNLPLSSQSKLLTVLQEREVVPVGGTQTQAIDVRIVAATNMERSKLGTHDHFRQDLLYRLNTIEVTIPPLRERIDDIFPLASFFLEKYTKKYNKSTMRFADEVIAKFKGYYWPGNVRELEHVVERAVLMAKSDVITDIYLENKGRGDDDLMEDLNLERAEARLVEKALKINHGNVSKAAIALGLTRAALYRRMEKHNL